MVGCRTHPYVPSAGVWLGPRLANGGAVWEYGGPSVPKGRHGDTVAGPMFPFIIPYPQGSQAFPHTIHVSPCTQYGHTSQPAL